MQISIRGNFFDMSYFQTGPNSMSGMAICYSTSLSVCGNGKAYPPTYLPTYLQAPLTS